MVKSPEGKVQGESRRVVTGQSESAEGRRLRRGAKPDTKPSKKGSTGQVNSSWEMEKRELQPRSGRTWSRNGKEEMR